MEDAPELQWTLIADPKTCESLTEFLKNSRFEAKIKLKAESQSETPIKAESANGNSLTFKKPVRLGDLLDTLCKPGPTNNKTGLIIEHPAFILNKTLGTLALNKNRKTRKIKLTEKEVAILEYLHNNPGRIVPRKELLSAVWEYAENVETHTLETHIYRLRQKIEQNPSTPQILCTEESGYILR
ncbi:MAG: winged helix-turn-helix domain-containing protein [Rhodospirillales bacterium]|nr:winged helix-turn-helix domain-containing protein [Alphaproteobacteria bacterium]MCB9977877.1 winged helix-turn-helix domain-containing protein [Rhodospirillales bacterium]